MLSTAAACMLSLTPRELTQQHSRHQSDRAILAVHGSGERQCPGLRVLTITPSLLDSSISS